MPSQEFLSPQTFSVRPDQPSKHRWLPVLILLLTTMPSGALLASPCAFQKSSEKPTASVTADQKKALKYHQALLRRPSPGYLYDRFYNTWLDGSSLEDLKTFLNDRAKSSNTTADRLLLAFFHARQGDDVAALQQFRAALKNDPGNAATLYEKAVVESRTLDFETALVDLAAAAAADPAPDDAIKIAQLRGKLLVRNRQIDDAVKVWQQLLKSNPADTGLMEDVVELQISEGLYEQAEALADQLIASTVDPFQKVIRRLRKGDIHQRAGKRQQALDVYGAALEQVGIDTWLEREILGQIDQLFRREDDLVSLVDHLKTMVKADSKRMAIRKALARIQMEVGAPIDAIATFQKIIQLTPGDRENREAFVSLLERAGQTAQAVKQMESLVTQHASDAELLVRLAGLCHKDSAVAKAKAAVEKFVELSGGNEYSFLRAARLLEKFGDKAAAEAMYQKSVVAFPDSEAAREAQAAFLFRIEQTDNAIAIWKSLAVDSDRAGLVRIARVASSRKQHQAAMDMLTARFDELKLDTIYLDQLCSEAIALKKFKQAVPWATERVRLSKTATEVESCLNPAVQIIDQAGQIVSTQKRLREKQDRNAAETCLLVELLDRSLATQEADSLLAEALELAMAAADKEPVQMLARQKVRVATSRQDWPEAASAARALVDLPGGRKSVNVRQLVKLYTRAGDDSSALKWIEQWKRLSPGSLLPWFSESNLLDRTGKFKESINVLRQATRKFPTESDLFAQLAQRYLNNGDAKDAQRIYWRQYEESEKLSDKLRWAERLAEVAEAQGELEQLVENLTERKKNNPKSIAPLLAIAQAHRVGDNYEGRRIALLEATRLQKDNLPLLMEIARMEESEGDWEQAVETLERASQLDKSNRAQQYIARIYIQYGETNEGLTRLLEIAGGNNSSAEDIEKIANSIVNNEDWEQLRDFMLPQVARYPKDYRLKYLLAVAHEELGDGVEAQRMFLDLVSANEDLPRLASMKSNNQTQAYYQRYYGQMRNLLPAGALEFMMAVSLDSRMAYSYRQRNGGFYGGVSTGLPLPNSLDNCRQYALAHLRDLTTDATEKQRKTLKRELNRAGVADVELMVCDIDVETLQQRPEILLERNPDNTNALAIAMMAAGNGQFSDEELCLKGYNQFKDSWPTLAFFAAMRLDPDQAKNQQRLEAAIKNLKKTGKPSSMVVMIIARQTANNDGMSAVENDGQGVGIQKYRTQLNQLIADWYPELSDDPNYAGWIFSQVAASLRREASSRKLIEFLDAEILREKPRKGASMPVARMYGRQQGDELPVLMPQFPPASLPEFSQLVYSQLNMSISDDRPNFFAWSGGNQEPMTPAQIKEAIPVAKNPLLKALLQIKLVVSDEEQTDAEAKDEAGKSRLIVEELLANSKSDSNAWYLAGCLAASESRREDASNIFETMRSLPIDANTRRKIDGHLVALVTEGPVADINAKKNSALLASARSAALRLRRSKLSQRQRTTLVEVFETLGLNEAAEKMEARIASNPALPGGVGGPAVAVATPAEKIVRLADQGKNDSASRLLAQEFRGLARGELDLLRMLQSDYQINQFKEKVGQVSLTKELLEQLDPGDATSARKLGTWGVAQEILGDKAIAKRIYEQLIETYPRQDATRLRLLRLEMADEAAARAAFVKHFSNIDKRKKATFIGALLRSLSARKTQADQLLNMLTAVISYVETSPEPLGEMSWMSQVLATSASRRYLEVNNYSFQTPHVYQREAAAFEKIEARSKSRSDRKKIARLKELAKRQRSIHDRIAQKMTELPGVAADGFTALLASRKASEKPVDAEMVQLALKVVYPSKTKGKSKSAPNLLGAQFTPFQSGGLVQVVKRTPVEFLARHYGLSEENHDDQIEAIATKLESLKDKDNAERIRHLYQLCRCDGADFGKVATAQIELAKAGRRPDNVKWTNAISNVVEIWTERKLEFDVADFVLDYAARKRNTSSWYGGEDVGAVSNYALAVAKSQGPVAVDAFLEKLRERLVGDRQQQAELLALLADPKKAMRNSRKLTPVSNYASVVKTLMNSRETFFSAARESNRFALPNQGSNIKYQLGEFIQSFKEGDVDALLQWLENSGLVDDLEHFDPIYQKNNSSEPTAWAEVLYRMDYRLNDDLRKQLVKKLEAKRKPTFGESLLAAYCKSGRANIYELVGKHRDAFDALPEEKQTQMARFVEHMADLTDVGRTVSDAGRQIKSICVKRLGKSKAELMDKLMKAKRFSALGIEDHELEDWSDDLLSSLDHADSDKVIAAIAKIAQWGEDKSRRNHISRNGGSSVRTVLVEQAIKNVDFNSIKLLLQLLRHKDFASLNYSGDIEKLVTGFLKAELDSARTKIIKANRKSDENAAHLKSLEELQNRLGNELGDQSLLGLLPVFQNLFSSMTSAQRKSLDKYLTRDAAHKYPQIANTFRVAWLSARELIQQKRSKRSKGSDGDRDAKPARLAEMLPWQSELISFVNDDSIAIQSRWPVASSLVTKDLRLPEEMVWDCVDVLGSAIDAGAGVDDKKIGEVFDVLLECQSVPKFTENAGAFAKKWTLRKLKGSLSYYSSTEDATLASAVRLLAKTANEAMVKRLLAAKPQAYQVSMLVALVENSMASEARDRFRKFSESDHSLTRLNHLKTEYTRSLEAGMPKFLDLFKNDGAKLCAQIMMERLENSKRPNEKVDSTPDARLEAIAKRFTHTEFKSRRLRQISLVLLAKCPATASTIGQPLAESTAALEIEDLLENDKARLQQQLFAANLGVQVSVGNFEPVKDAWDKLNDSSVDQDNWRFRDFVRAMSAAVSEPLTRKVESASAEELQQMLPEVSALADPSTKHPLVPELNALLHLITGRTDEFVKSWEAVEDRDDEDRQRVDMDDFLEEVRQWTKKQDGIDAARRKKLVSDVWTIGAKCKFSIGSGHFQSGVQESCSGCRTRKFGLEQLAKLRLLNDDDVLEMGPELAEQNSVNGEIWRQLAKRQLEASRLEEAAESFHKALEASTDDMEMAKLNRRVEYADALVKLDRNGEAAELLKEIDTNQLLGDNVQRYQQLKGVLDLK